MDIHIYLYTWKQMIFTKTLQEMFKKGLILQIMSWTDYYQKGEEKGIWISESRIRWKKYKKNAGLSVKTYSYLIDEGSDYKKAKGTKKDNFNLKIIKTA